MVMPYFICLALLGISKNIFYNTNLKGSKFDLVHIKKNTKNLFLTKAMLLLLRFLVIMNKTFFYYNNFYYFYSEAERTL